MWIKAVVPQLERKGFPPIDPLHDGRPVPLVRRFYDGYFGITTAVAAKRPGGEADGPKALIPVHERSAALRPELNLDARSQTVLRHMIKDPKARTHRHIRGVGELTLQRLAEYGVIESKGFDARNDRIWTVTDIGREEIKRIDYWYYGKRM